MKRLDDYLIQENDQDAVVIRYGEVILNLAESAVELSTYGVNDYLAVAQVAFDQLRSIHGGLPAKTMDLEVVRHERRIDLMYEGFRYWDLRRWRLAGEVIDGKQAHGTKITKKDDNTYTYEQVSCDDNINRFFPERYYLLPIPVDELQNNPLCENNAPW